MRPPSTDPEDTEIASNFTVRQYKAARDARKREEIADAIRRRFTGRYVEPALKPTERHGFTMMAISCLMIEAFVSLQRGWKTSKGAKALGAKALGAKALSLIRGNFAAKALSLIRGNFGHAAGDTLKEVGDFLPARLVLLEPSEFEPILQAHARHRSEKSSGQTPRC
jgi:hypothetical protein